MLLKIVHIVPVPHFPPLHGTPPTLPMNFNTATNRIWDDGDGVYMYDSAGNLTQDGTHGYVYDTENRITCVLGTDGTCTSNTATVYSYDPDGQRVSKTTGTGTPVEDYVYDFSGHQVSAHNSSGTLRNELYDPDGRHTATYSGSIWTYNFADWLGTERVRTNSNQTELCTDMPYGMNLACTGGAA